MTEKREITEAAEKAAELEQGAKSEQDNGTYIHDFKAPFPCQGKEYEQLTFCWESLTGADYLEIENELLLRGRTLVTPEFTGDFLCGMMVRACTEKDPEGRRILDGRDMRAMPLGDFHVICKKARSFLLHAGS